MMKTVHTDVLKTTDNLTTMGNGFLLCQLLAILALIAIADGAGALPL